MKNLKKTNKLLNRKNRNGFTLIEIVIVVAIIGILAAIAIPRFGTAQKNAKKNADEANAKIIQNAVAMAISEGKIDIPNDEKIIELYSLDNSDANEIKKYLNGNEIPKVQQYEDGYFCLTIDENGNIKVEPQKKTESNS